MLHFLGDKLDVVCICVCDWGEVECLQEVTSSLYDFAEDQDATNIKKCIGGLYHNCFCLQQIRNCKFPSTIGKTTCCNFDV